MASYYLLLSGLELRVGDLWIKNLKISWSNKPKICKTSIFQKLLFPKYDNFKIISTGNIRLSISLDLNEGSRLNDERTKLCKIYCYTLKLKTITIYFTKQYLFYSRPVFLILLQIPICTLLFQYYRGGGGGRGWSLDLV